MSDSVIMLDTNPSLVSYESATAYHGAVIDANLPIDEKLKILSDAAKYDVACTSSGVDRKGKGKGMGNAQASGICHTFAGDGRCISLLKILMTNECIYDCKYCINRRSNDVVRTTFTPEEICTLTMEFYRRNYIEGLFLSSGIIHSPNHTMELIYQVIYLLRIKHHFGGYIHIKAIPGVDQTLLEQVGYLCDRMSINLELPTAKSLSKLAPNKTRQTILAPMKQIQTGIYNSRLNLGITNKYEKPFMEANYYASIKQAPLLTGTNVPKLSEQTTEFSSEILDISNFKPSATDYAYGTKEKYFVPAGQSTQMIIGATDESDYQLLTITENLYKQFDLKRVFFSAFVPVNEDPLLPTPDTKPPLLREHRLYQADFLLRFYGFGANELLDEKHPTFNEQIDPKCNWAVHHLEFFPLEIMTAGYYALLRVPGIGVKSARRIIAARKYGTLDYSDLKKMGVVLKRAQFFITCNGKMLYRIPIEERFITNQLIYGEKPFISSADSIQYSQPTLFDYGLSQA